MKTLNFFALITALILISYSINAQNRWSLEFRPNIDFPTDDIGDIELKTGFGFEVAVSYNFMQHISAYLGWGYNTFKTTSNLTEFDNDVDMTGYTFGLQFIHQITEDSNFSYLIRVGGIYNHLEFEDANGDVFEDSGHGLGYEFGFGLDYTFSGTWHLRPQIAYRALSRDIDVQNNNVEVDLNYIAFGVGISKSF